MGEISKIIDGLNHCIGEDCPKCPYYDVKDGCSTALMEAAHSVLQVRTAEAEIEGGGTNWFFVCGECHTAIDAKDKYCRQCGREIVWQ